MTAFLLAAATLLGMLAFFEPCTIATNTLYSVRAHREGTRRCCHELITVWLARCALSVTLLAVLVAVLPRPEWGPWMPSMILAVMALVYVVSRFVYLPVPHLEFWRLLPGGRRLGEGLRLGLTLPACTLPLFAVVAGIAVTADSIAAAIWAGLAFGSFFTLPMVAASLRGLGPDARDLLDRAARGSPWATAVLLLGTALYLLPFSLGVDRAALEATLFTPGWAGLGMAFAAGFVFSFNPVSFASIPVVLAYVTKAHEEKRAVLMGGAFVAGMVVTHVVLGMAAALGGGWAREVMGREWGLVLGPLLIVLGLMWPGWLRLRLPWRGMRGWRAAGFWGAFALGVPFSVAVCPFCTPALLVALTASAAVGSLLYGSALLLAFALGRSIPIMLGAWSMGWLESLRVLSRHQRLLEVAAGVVLILTGLYLLNEYFFIIGY